MGRSAVWLAVFALVLGLGAAVAFAERSPIPTTGISVYYDGPGGATARDDEKWIPLTCECNPRSLWMLEPIYVRGPAIVSVDGMCYALAPNQISRLAWNPASRVWAVGGWCGVAGADGFMFGGGGGSDGPGDDPNIPEVSGFDPTEIPPDQAGGQGDALPDMGDDYPDGGDRLLR